MSYILGNPGDVWRLLVQHVVIVASALGIATLFALPVGVGIARVRWLATPVLGVLGIMYTVPSIALIILLIPLFGLNARAVIAALVVYTQVILVRNIVAGLLGIDPAIHEAARGMGMNAWQRWWRVELPLALPVMLAGLRLAAVVAIGIATLGAKFGAGGLGRLLFDGVAQVDRYDKIWAGALGVGALALVVNWGLLALEQGFRTENREQRTVKQ